MYISIDILISKKIVYSTKEQLYEKTIENIFMTVQLEHQHKLTL